MDDLGTAELFSALNDAETLVSQEAARYRAAQARLSAAKEAQDARQRQAARLRIFLSEDGAGNLL